MKKTILLFVFFIAYISVFAQKIEPAILQKRWQAQWISHATASPTTYGIYLFRKTFELTEKPQTFIIHVSADNRYKLFVNEKLVSLGPARGDLNNWNFETVDIAPYLNTGKNSIAAQVWNEAEWRPEAQISLKTGFILQGSTLVNTNNSWKCMQDSSYTPTRGTPKQYYVAGAGEFRNMALSPKNWQSVDFDDSQWKNAKSNGNGTPKSILGAYGSANGWMLVPSMIPQMELTNERIQKVAKVEGNLKLPEDFPQKSGKIVIPANSTIQLLLDQSYLTNAYPNLFFSGGKNAKITLIYAEALYEKGNLKGNRNEIEGKTILGRTDNIISDGSDNQYFTTLAYRTYRYIQLTIKTEEESLMINDIYGIFTGYPFVLKAKLETGKPEISKMLEIGWRTARLCATETYMDCPYYEQLQYIGDARIQALITLYNSGDERMVKNALTLMDNSRLPEGLTESRHPSYTPQYIPTFSLWYIGMLQDYARYGSDLDFVKKKIGGTRQILDYFKNYQQADGGSLKNVPQWMFTDWVDKYNDSKILWNAGVSPMGADGTSAAIDLQLLLAYQTAADLENKLGLPAMALSYQTEIEQLKKTIREKYWIAEKQLFADRAEKDVFSQHTNALAILTGITTKEETEQIAQSLLTNPQLAPASIYFKYYLHQALIKAGKGDDYLKWLDKWRENMVMGLTTWAEISEVDKSRSDCHAWGASPNIEFYRTILGIDSEEMGFSKVKIEPHLGELTAINGTMPHPKGSITASYKLENGKWKIRIETPVAGNLIWKGKKIALKEGLNQIVQ